MKNSNFLMISGGSLSLGFLSAIDYFGPCFWFLVGAIAGLTIFVFGSMKVIKNLENEKY